MPERETVVSRVGLDPAQSNFVDSNFRFIRFPPISHSFSFVRCVLKAIRGAASDLPSWSCVVVKRSDGALHRARLQGVIRNLKWAEPIRNSPHFRPCRKEI